MPKSALCWLTVPARPLARIVFGKANGVVLPSSGAAAPPKPHWMPSSLAKSLVVRTMRASISTCGCGASRSTSSAVGAVDARLQVGDDQVVGARVHLNRRALGQRRAQEERRHVGRLGVGQRLGHRHQLAGERLLLGQLAARLAFRAQRLDRRDADDRALDRVVELIGAQDDVERVIPRHFVQRDVDDALDLGIDDQVEAGDLGEGAEHRAEVDALEVEADRVAGEAARRHVAGLALRHGRLGARGRVAAAAGVRTRGRGRRGRARSAALASVKSAGVEPSAAGSPMVTTTLRPLTASGCTR